MMFLTYSEAFAGRVFYVSSSYTGSVSNGSFSNPWNSLSDVQNAITSILPGDSILFKRGDKFNGSLAISVSGTSTNKIVFASYGSGADPLFWGTGNKLPNLFSVGNQSYIVFYGLKICDTTISSTDRTIVSRIQTAFGFDAGSSNNIIRKCTLDRVGIGAFFAKNSSYNMMDSCDIGNLRMVINDNTNSNNDYGANPTVISGYNNTITHNFFHDCWANSYDYGYDGGAVEFYGSGANNNFIAYNTFYDCNNAVENGSGNGGTILNNTFAYNKFINNGGVYYINNSGTYAVAVSNMAFYNNVFIQTTPSRVGTNTLGAMSSSSSNQGIVIFKNNIFYVTTGTDVVRANQWNSGQLVHQNNIYNLSNGSVINLTLSSSEFLVTDNIWTNTNNPNPLYWNYTPIDNSLAINFGQNLGYDLDYVGNLILGLPDAGVIENTSVLNSTNSTTIFSCGYYILPWGDSVTTTGTYSHTYVSSTGSDSVVAFYVKIKSPTSSVTSISICSSDLPYTWNGLTFTESGTKTAHFTNRFGCDSAATLNLSVNLISTSNTDITICSTELPYFWNGLRFNSAGSQTAHFINAVGCDSSATLNLSISPITVPDAPSGVVQTLVDNSCGERIYRYAVSTTTYSATAAYAWTLPVTVGGEYGVFVDSGDVNVSSIIRLKYTTNAAALSATDSIKVRAYSDCGSSATKSYKLTNAVWAPLKQPTITATKLDFTCGLRKVRYSSTVADTTSGTVTYEWSFVGNGLGDNAVIDSGTTDSRVIVVKYTSDSASNNNDSVRVRYNYNYGCSYGAYVKSLIGLSAISAPSVTGITATLITSTSATCSGRKVRYAVSPYPDFITSTSSTVPSTVAGNGYLWSFAGDNLHAGLGVTFVIDSMDVDGLDSSSTIVVRYLNNEAPVNDSVRCAYKSACGIGPSARVKIPFSTALSQPAAPTAVTATTVVSNICSGRKVRYSVPLAPVTTTTAPATGYDWSFAGSTLHAGLGSSYIIDSMDSRGLSSSSVIIVKYLIDVAAASDSVRCAYKSACGTGAIAKVKVPLSAALSQPAAPTAVTATTVVSNICSGRKVRYSVPQAPVTTTTAPATGYDWSFAGSTLHAGLGLSYVIDSMDASGLSSSRVIVVKYLSNVASNADSVRCAYKSVCGTGAIAKVKVPLSAALSQPAAPTAVTATTVVSNICSGRKVRYSVPQAPVTTTTAPATGYEWSFGGSTLHAGLGSSYVIDSMDSRGLSSSSAIVVKYLVDISAGADSVRCAYKSACGTGAIAKVKVPLSAALSQPSAPTAVTATTVVSNICGGRKVRYSVPLAPVTTTTAPATGYGWSFVGSTLHSGLQSTYLIDSMDVNGLDSSRVIVVKYLVDVAAGSDSVRCAYKSACGTGAIAKVKVPLSTVLSQPAAPTAVTATTVVSNICSGRKVRYSVPQAPVSTTTAPATGYSWSFAGSTLHAGLGSSYVIDSMDNRGLSSSSVIVVKYLIDIAASSDSVRCAYKSSCGTGAVAKVKVPLSTVLSQPAAPTAVTTTTVVSNICGGRKVRYSVPQAPASTTTAPAIGYDWSFAGSTLHAGLGVSYIIDSMDASGLSSSRVIVVKYLSNVASNADSVRCAYKSACGTGAIAKAKVPLNSALTTCRTVVTNNSNSSNAQTANENLTTTSDNSSLQQIPKNNTTQNLPEEKENNVTINANHKLTDSSKNIVGVTKSNSEKSPVPIKTQPIIKSSNNNQNTINQKISPVIEIFPNPTTSIFNLQLDNAFSNKSIVPYKIIVCNSTGQKVFETVTLSKSLNFGKFFEPGIYFISVTQEGRVLKTIKAIKI